ncbi:MAG: neutral/alkaline non-lysosomal ceramidase N-terminal domain-containing protein [Deltaproteobacteria bacterium]|nr:neutral/alkaline non-lysosomal ceramidase N-terminal domain-containing protein [Deltaproteobacteria bacterium]
MKTRLRYLGPILLASLILACGGDENSDADAGPGEVTTAHCAYEPMPEGANVGGAVDVGPLNAGAAEQIIDIPVGTALGGYTARAGFLGTAGTVDLRELDWSGSFNPSIGVESAPRVKAVVLTADSETVVLLKIDAIFPYEAMTIDIAEALGPEYRGKVLVSASHTHSGWAQYTGHSGYQVGAGILRDKVYKAYIDTSVAVVQKALAARQPAKLGMHVDFDFDPTDQVNRDRRGENDMLPGGDRDDSRMFLMRIDGVDDQPIAIIPIYGLHGTLLGEDNSFASTDSTGAMERLVEEKFDSEVVVMHLQGAAGDVSPTGHGGIDCDVKPGDEDDPCFGWASAEGHGRVAADVVYQAWEQASANMQTDLALEMLTRSVPLGPNPKVFSIRAGSLSYAPFARERIADQTIWSADKLASPIDEFNAPVGAALCEEEYPMFPAGLMPGTDGLPPYGSCVRADTAGSILGELRSLEFETSETQPICQSTRTLVSAIRVGDYVIGTVPGELTVMLAERIRTQSPVAPENTIVLGYSQGFTGYSLTPEDWVAGGFEASTNFWGPLEGEYLAERALELMDLAVTSEREDGAADGVDRISTPEVVDDVPLDDPAPLIGSIPELKPERVWLRTGARAETQPDAIIERVAGHAVFTWAGEDPKLQTPLVTLQREVGEGVFEDVRRRSGRLVRDAELLLMYTPLPLRREDGPQTHYWSVEWQAVPWVGASVGETAIDGLDSVAGLPVGRYRFHVEGSGYQLDSQPFEVTTAVLRVGASLAGSSLSISGGLLAPKGYRAIDLVARSNERVPLRSQTVTVSVVVGGDTLVFNDVVLDGSGNASVDLGGQAGSAQSVTITDRFGNAGTASL